MNRLEELAKINKAITKLESLRDWIYEAGQEENSWTKEIDTIVSLLKEL